MEPEDQIRVFSPEERGALVAAAQVWEGTQAEFAAQHGVCQSTVSKWLTAAAASAGIVDYEARKAEVIERAGTWTGFQRDLARAMGLGSGTVSRWFGGDARSRRYVAGTRCDGADDAGVRPPARGAGAPGTCARSGKNGRPPDARRGRRPGVRHAPARVVGGGARRGAAPTLNIPASTKIQVASEPVDIRWGMDALAGWVEENGLDVYSGHLFVSLSRRMTHVKVLTWSRGVTVDELLPWNWKAPAA